MPGTNMNVPSAEQKRGMQEAAKRAALERVEEAQVAFKNHQEKCQGKGKGGPVSVSNNGAVYTFKPEKHTW